MDKERGIFSIENVWFEENDSDYIEKPDVTSIEPILHALSRGYRHQPYVHRDVATKEELKFFIKRWCSYPTSYPILHIGIHGTPGHVHLPDGSEVSLSKIASWIDVSCENCIVHFSSCATQRATDPAPFLEQCGFSAVSGYSKTMYPMVDAWPFEMIYLGLLNKTRHKDLTPDAMRTVDAKLSKAPYGEFKKGLGFKMKIAR